MKKTTRLALILATSLILVLVIAACLQDNAKVPESDGITEVPESDGITLEENIDYVKRNKQSVDFELEDLNGNKVRLSDYKGQIVFLSFWSTWCPSCRKQMPYFEAIHQQYGDKGVKILAVSSTQVELQGGNDSDRARNQVKSFIDDGGFTLPIPLDPDSEVLGEYNKIYPVIGIPTTYMIDREGIIRYVLPGAFQDEEHIKAFIALFDQE